MNFQPEQQPGAMVTSTGHDLVRLSASVGRLPGVSPRRARALQRLGIETVWELLRHLPVRYEAESAESSIGQLTMGTVGSARGVVAASRWVPALGRGSKPRFEATLRDGPQQLTLVWFNARYLSEQLHPGHTVRVQGKVGRYGGVPQMVNPQWELLDDAVDAPIKPPRLRAVYPATEDLPSSAIESIIARTLPQVCDQIVDPLSGDFLRERALPELAASLRQVHQPGHEDDAAGARRRLAYNELLLLQLGIALKRYHNHHAVRAASLAWSPAIDRHIRARFPFELTRAQDRVVKQMVADLRRDWPMNRLLQGDVRSGKTVVALYALLMAAASRKQGALLAPTELLAEQHYLSITDMLRGSNVRIGLLTAGASVAGSTGRQAMLRQIETGELDIVVGTQALTTGAVRFSALAVVVVDEQHRFGVLQRAALRQPHGGDEPHDPSPHHLVMTATPIPRTLSLTVFGDLDVSTIDQLPPGRSPVVTRVCSAARAEEVYAHLVQQLGKGGQAYVVVPAIDDDPHPSLPLASVAQRTQWLQQRLGHYRVAAIHGQLQRSEREVLMQAFRDGHIHVLVATTVIEVGVDVPNATMMVVEHADRFGLAQLHQLRGRIGRGRDGRQSLCVFLADPKTDQARQRLETIDRCQDGFRIAERDLEIRGMGEFFGTRQHGFAPLRVARIPQDMALLQMARRDGQAIVDADPALVEPTHTSLRKILLRQYGDTLGLIDVG